MTPPDGLTVITWRGEPPTLAEVVSGMAPVPCSPGGPDGAWFASLSTVMREAYGRRLAGLGAATEPGGRLARICCTLLYRWPICACSSFGTPPPTGK